MTETRPRRAPRAARLLTCTLWLAAAASGASAQDVELYERPDFGGTRLTMNAATPDLARYGAGSSVSSVVVTRGQWEFCTQPQFRGACVTVGPGRYARLPPALNDNLASLRRVGEGPSRPDARPDPRPDAQGRPGIVLYAGDFSGRELRLSEAVTNLAVPAFNDTATTIDVLAGTWDLCSDGGFAGQCLRFQPGRYALPPALRDRLSSLRPVQAQRPPEGHGGPGDPAGPGRPWAGAKAAIVFHENRDFSGRELPLATAAARLGAMGFNDRASAVEIVRGRWQLCRDVDFQGGCVVFGPGRYVLDGRLQDAVSSARPVWGRDDRPLQAAGAVTLHDSINLRGRSLFVDSELRDLRDQRFNDRTVAIEVHGGRWELCNRGDYRGACVVFGPGWHRLPEELVRQVSSLRPR